MHHFADPDRVLADVFASTRPGGLLAVAEMSEQLRFLPDDVGVGTPGLETRCLDVLRAEHTHSLPNLGSDWAPRVAAAGFTVLAERTFAIALDPPYPAGTARYAHRWLERLRTGLGDRLSAEDLHALADLTDSAGPNSVYRRGDLRVRGSRTVTLAQRPD
jgi:hypothetical protein